MRKLNLTLSVIFTSLMALTSCKSDDDENVQLNDKVDQTDNLQKVGVLGTWKLNSRAINGISSLAVECCDFIKLKSDSLATDLKGFYSAFGVGYEINGQFGLSEAIDTIEFIADGEQKIVYEVQISDSSMVFSYKENNDAIVENWRK